MKKYIFLELVFQKEIRGGGGEGISDGPTSSNKDEKGRETQVGSAGEEYIRTQSFFFLLYSRQKYRRSSMLSSEHYTTGQDDF